MSLGLGLTIVEVISPLRNGRFIAAALVVNFVLVPVVAVIAAEVVRLPNDVRIGLILIACAAGAPMIPKLVQIAKGDAATAIALVTLLIVATAGFLPLAVPLLLPGVDVEAGTIALSLSGQMLVPLAAGLFVRARWEEEAAEYRPAIATIANITLVLLFLVSVGQNLSGVLDLVGTGGILALLVVIGAAVVAGFVSAYPGRVERRVMALGAGQRNLAAAFIVANANFADQPDTLIYVATAGLIMMIVLFPLAGEFSQGRRGAACTRGDAL
ncbi:MAG: bile acid:sodium symporter [Actinomycetota bacterium]|nr:bile acid:sodium symporter [Actinomycetota bacterium]